MQNISVHTATDLVNSVYYPASFIQSHSLHQDLNKVDKTISFMLSGYILNHIQIGWTLKFYLVFFNPQFF